jgi:Zn-dependent M28 family amino/carboxypeptidase
MIGDKDLGIVLESNSNPGLRRLVWKVAEDLGYGRYFLEQAGAIEDDHMPFIRDDVPALDLIDFDYGPNNSYWHTEKDTVDKLSAQSLKVVGDVLLETLRRLEK